MCPTTVNDVDMAVMMISLVNPHIAGFGTEFMAITDAIKKFRDYFYENMALFQIPSSKITELDSYIALFKVYKYHDRVAAKEYNNMVEALNVVGQLVAYAGVLYYTSGIYIAPTLKAYYPTKYDDYYPPWFPASVIILALSSAWRLWTSSAYPQDKVTSEGWFLANRHYGSARVRVKYSIPVGKTGQTHISVLFLTSGSPLGSWTQSVLQRGDVSIAGRADFPYTAGTTNYDTTVNVSLNANITYIVVCCQDRFTDTYVRIQIQQLWITPT